MLLSASARKSITDLSRRRTRTVLTVLSLAIAVASISFLAIPPLIDRAMQDEVRIGRLADATIAMRPVELSDDQLSELAALPNVAGVEGRSTVDARVLVGERRAPARLLGVRGFEQQDVDVVRLDSGTFPGAGALLSDVQNANVGVYDGRAGDRLTVLGPGGEQTQYEISGRGRSLPGGEQVQDDDVIVLYAPAATVAELSGEPGYGELALRLDDPSPEAAAATVASVREHLAALPGFSGFSDLPDVREPGDWPGKSDTEAFGQLLGVITALALLSAVVLIANTTSTLVAEQTREIGVMRAIGAQRRQVAMVYLRTTLLLGAAGAVAGTVLGVAMSSLLARYFGTEFWAIDVAAGVHPPVLVASILVGLLAPPLAALPAIRRGLRVDLRDALEASGSTFGGQGPIDRQLRRVGFLPRTAQIGLRNAGRRKRRSFATALMIAVAVANLLAVLALAEAATDTTRAAWADHLEDAQVSTGGRARFGRAERDAILATPGIAEAEPVIKNTVMLDGREAFVWGVEQDPLFRYRLADGRWFDEREADAGAPVAVIERNIAQIAGVSVGDRITVDTAAGEAELDIVGIAKNQQEEGTALYVPLSTTRALLGQPDAASAFWIRTTSSDEDTIDRTVNLVEDRLADLGHEVSTEVTYVAARDEIDANRSLTTTIAVLGFVVVAMSMVGLANAITTNVLERTREIGILRSIGARARDVRRIFVSEGIVLAVGGWLLGIPLGYALTRLLVRFVWEVVDVRLPVVFPPWNVVLALAGTIVLALLVLALPVHRAVRFRAGDALRYA